MKKTIIENKRLGESYLRYEHESGLTVLLYPMQGFRSTYALFGTKLGSIDTMFRTGKDEEFLQVPEGVAHFLEHKLFEGEEGDAFALFAKTGASANAYTSFERTCYLFSATDHIMESLQSLLKFVQEPYFTAETVQKEQGIIGQEIRMYDDSPDWRVFFNLLNALYHNHPVRIDIAGTVDSIAKIDDVLLYKCYHAFYNLNNMVLAMAGNFDPEEAVKVIEQNLKPSQRVTVEQKVPEEPDTIVKSRVEQSFSVSVPLFQIGFKEKPRSGLELIKTQIGYELLLEMLVGESSAFYLSLYEQGLINPSFGYEVFCGRGYMANCFSGESKDPDRVLELLLQEIARVKREGFAEEDFQRCQKAMYGKAIRGFHDVENVANALVSCHFADIDAYTYLEVISQITPQDMQALLADSLLEDRAALSIVCPAKEDKGGN